MLKIGEFSKLSRVSVRMLRHYDEIGLLKPAVTVASCTFKGGYDQMDSAMAAVTAWVNDNGYEPDGPLFNSYHISPHETKNPQEFVTEVCCPVRKK